MLHGADRLVHSGGSPAQHSEKLRLQPQVRIVRDAALGLLRPYEKAACPSHWGGVLARPSFFGEGRSFKLCAAHLGKACMLFGVSAARKSRAVIAAGRGLAKAGGRSSAPPRPAISRDQLIRLVATNGRHNEKTMIDLISWTFLRRAPSESLPLCGRQSGEDMGSDGRLESKAVSRLSGGKETHGKRKHMARGSKFVRVCICEDYAPEAL